MRWMILTCLGVVLLSGPLPGQDEALTQAAEEARAAWHRHDTRALMEPAVQGVLLHLRATS